MLALSRCQVLYVTGNAAEYEIFAGLIAKNSTLTAHLATTAQDALSEMVDNPDDRPSLIVIDWSVPGTMTSRQFLTSIKDDNILKSIPVLVLTIELDSEELGRIYSLGASCVIHRGPGPEDFAATVGLICRFWGNVASLPFCEQTDS